MVIEPTTATPEAIAIASVIHSDTCQYFAFISVLPNVRTRAFCPSRVQDKYIYK